MSGFKVNLANMNATSENLAAYQKVLENSSQAVVEAHRNLDRYSSFMENMDGSMVKIEKSIQELAITMNSLSKVLKSISEEYQKTEAKISGESIDGKIQQNQTQGEASQIQDKDTRPEDFLDLIKKLSGIFSTIAEYGENDGFEIFGSFTSLAASLLKLWNLDDMDTFAHRLGTNSDIFGSGAKTVKAVLKLFGEKENAVAAGVVASAMGIFSELTKATDRNVVEQFKESWKLINTGGGLSKGIYQLLGNKTLSAAEKGKVAAISAAFSMVTGAIGNVIEKSGDGVFDVQDLADTSLNTGVTGLVSLVSGCTFGVVNLDIEHCTTIFNDLTKNLQDVIRDTGAPLPVQVLMVVPGSVAVTVIGAGEIVWDYTVDVFDKIGNVVWGK